MEDKMTYALALSATIHHLYAIDYPNQEVIDKLEKMLEQKRKKPPKSNSPSLTRRENERLARTVAETIPPDTTVNSKWIMAHVSHIRYGQKLRYITEAGVEMGILERIEPEKKSGKPTFRSLIH